MNKINKIIAGVDEVGRGPLAGPVVACAYIQTGKKVDGVKDSKKLSKKKRELLYDRLVEEGCYSIAECSVSEIDDINILEATKLAINRAVENLTISPDEVIIDGNMKFTNPNFKSVVKADDQYYEVSAASIIAKIHRDNIMCELSKKFPEYLWEKNSAYGTKAHIEAIEKYGLTEHHRKSFCKKWI